MPPSSTIPRPPLQVEVITKTPIRTGLNISTPQTTGAITRASTQAAASNTVSAEVVQNVPAALKNITPISLGQRATAVGSQIGNFGKNAVAGIAEAFTGVSAVTVGAVAAGILAADAAIFAEPVGVGSDMIGGVKFGSQPKPKIPTSTSTSTKPQALPQPFKPRATPSTTAPTKPKTTTQAQPQIEIQPFPTITTEQPQSAPTQPRSQPRSQPQPITIPGPRTALEQPTPTRTKPTLEAKSPFPLNIIDLNSYGGVNLTYPIAQKLIEIEFNLNELPQTFQNIIRSARIETTINLPAKVDLISQLPLKLDLSKQVPVTVDLRKEVPIALDISSQLPLKLDLSKQVPVTVDLRKEVPIALDISSQLPLKLDLSKQVPVTVDLRKEVPINVNISAILQPDSQSHFKELEKELKQCCEATHKELKKQSAIIEGAGSLICGEGSTPYSYKGEGLKGIHQLLQIMMEANNEILDHVCSLNIEYPLIQGSGTYGCGTLPPTSYHYSGLGFIGLQNQIDHLFGLDKKILTEVCSITEASSLGTLPNISGKIEYFDCDHSTHVILYSGNGIQGLSNQVDALSSLVKVGLKASCDTSAIVLMPDMRSEQFKATRQLVITWGLKFPTQQGSLWHSYVPNPIEGLTWCKDFENLSVTKGTVAARLFWENSKVHTGIYCQDEEEARRVITKLAAFSGATPEQDENGNLNPRITKGGKIKRKPAVRNMRVVHAAIVEIGSDGEKQSVISFKPSPEGCLPTIL
jgi:hypothetical protein